MIVNLQGGMGNQMFQYAYARSRSPRPLCNVSRLGIGNPPRSLELWPWVDVELTNEEGETGYFQDEWLFDASLVRFLYAKPHGEPFPKTRQMAERIVSGPSCFVGVRRSDYLWPDRIGHHGVMDKDYYCRANLELPVDLDRRYFVFTDDIPWAKENLPEFMEIVEVNGPKEKHWDIWLMSLCTHAIIANSTFHWWGAWLGPDRKGTVVAPKVWLADGTPWPIVPDRWIKV